MADRDQYIKSIENESEVSGRADGKLDCERVIQTFAAQNVTTAGTHQFPSRNVTVFQSIGNRNLLLSRVKRTVGVSFTRFLIFIEFTMFYSI